MFIQNITLFSVIITFYCNVFLVIITFNVIITENPKKKIDPTVYHHTLSKNLAKVSILTWHHPFSFSTPVGPTV